MLKKKKYWPGKKSRRGELSKRRAHSNGENHRGGPPSDTINSFDCSKHSFEPFMRRSSFSFFSSARFTSAVPVGACYPDVASRVVTIEVR